MADETFYKILNTAIKLEEEQLRNSSFSSQIAINHKAYLEFLKHTKCQRAFALTLTNNSSIVDILDWDKQTYNQFLIIIGKLLQLYNDGLASWDPVNKTLNIPDIILCQLPSHYFHSLGLPKPGNIQIKITTTGVAYTESFRVKINYILNNSLVMYPVTDGIVFTSSKQDFILPSEIFYANQSIKEFSNKTYQSIEEKNYAWAATTSVLSLSPCKNELEDQIGSARLVSASRLSIETDKFGNIRPVFLTPSISKYDDYIPLLSPNESDSATKFLNTNTPLRGHIALGNRAYLFLSPEVREVVSIIRDINKGSGSDKASFFANPTKIIVDKLEKKLEFENIGEIIDNIFIETPNYLSQRVEAFGPWEPKSCSFIKPIKTEWFHDSSDRYGIMINGDYIWVSVLELQDLIKRIDDARSLGMSSIKFNNQNIDISNIDISALESLLSKLKSEEYKHISPQKSSTKSKIKHSLMGPLLKTNIEELEYKAETNKHLNFNHPFSGLNPAFKLYPHQEECLAWLQQLWRDGWPGALLADDMGLGKTLQSLSFVKWLHDGWKNNNQRKPALVIAPAGLIINWKTEAIKYFGDSFDNLITLTGIELKRFTRMLSSQRLFEFSQACMVFTTYETVRDKNQLFSNVDWGITILDEAQKVKNPNARLTNAVASLKQSFVLAMTGTPVENSFLDLWSIMNIAVPGFLRSAKEFASNFCNDDDIERSGRELNEILTGGKTQPDDSIKQVSVRLMLRRLKEEQLTALPRKKEDVQYHVMPPLQAQAYRKILADHSNHQFRTEESLPGLVALQRLAQCSLSPEPLTDETEFTDDFIKQSARLSALFDILDNIKTLDEKAIIFVQRLQVQSSLANAIQQRYKFNHRPGTINGTMNAINRQRVVSNFQSEHNKGFDVLILTGRAAGTGLTLTAANHVIHLERWWNPAVEDQCSDRVYRIGQKHNVTIHIPIAILAPNDTTSFDIKLNQFLKTKRIRSSHILRPSNEESNANTLIKEILN